MTIVKKISLLIICILFLSFCKKKKAEEPAPAPAVNNTPTMNGSMTATLNGVGWTSTTNTGVLLIDMTNSISALVLNGETSANIFALGVDLPTASSNLIVDTHDIGLTKDDAV